MRENIYKCDVSTEDGATRRSEGDERDARTPVGLGEKRKETKCKSASSLRAKTQRMSLWSATACDALSGSGSGPGLGSRSGTAENSGTALYVGERAL
jgi:hypothetical protein